MSKVEFVNIKKDLRLYCLIKNKRSLEKIENCIQNGCNVNSRFINYGCTALTLAIESGLPKTIKLFIKYGAIISSSDLEIACQNGQYKIVKILINAKPGIIKEIMMSWAIPPNIYWNKCGGQSYTERSVIEKSLKMVYYLLQKGAYVGEFDIKYCKEYEMDSPSKDLYQQLLYIMEFKKYIY